jgi:hypothetical protein
MYDSGDYTVAQIAEEFRGSRPTIYRYQPPGSGRAPRGGNQLPRRMPAGRLEPNPPVGSQRLG